MQAKYRRFHRFRFSDFLSNHPSFTNFASTRKREGIVGGLVVVSLMEFLELVFFGGSLGFCEVGGGLATSALASRNSSSKSIAGTCDQIKN